MEHEIIEAQTGADLPAIADDTLLYIAKQAEARIDAVIKIKQMALKVTNPYDWTDQGGKPYLQVSGSEKIANLFGISWRINEPTFEEEADGHFTYTYRGQFSVIGRSIEVDGSRSSKDPFFKKYIYPNGVKTEAPISAIDRRDVKMAAMTNLLGNGISRLLGIRNLTWDDLEKFAGIKREQVGKIDYDKGNKGKEPIKQPQAKSEKKEESEDGEVAIVELAGIVANDGKNTKTGKEYTRYILSDRNEQQFITFDHKFGDVAKSAKTNGVPVKITFKKGKFGNDIVSIEEHIPEEAA